MYLKKRSTRYSLQRNVSDYQSNTHSVYYPSTRYVLCFPPSTGRCCMAGHWYGNTNMHRSRLILGLKNRLGALGSIVSLPDDPESSFPDTFERFCGIPGNQPVHVLVHPPDHSIFATGDSGTSYWRLGDKHGTSIRPAGIFYACICPDWGTRRTGEALVTILAFG